MQPDLFTTEQNSPKEKTPEQKTPEQPSANAGAIPESIDLDPEGRCFLTLYRGFYHTASAQHLFDTLYQEIPWRRDNIRIAGKLIPIPRLQAWFGTPEASYSYSGIQLQPTPFTPLLDQIRQDMESLGDGRHRTDVAYNSLLANLYQNGNDSVGWHSDNEPELGCNPVIASVSLGCNRRFSLKPRDRSRPPLHLDLNHGDVLIMAGATQHHWIHQVAKTRLPVTHRINLTFRKIHVK